MSALELRTIRGNRWNPALKAKFSGSNCHDALHRKEKESAVGVRERWGRDPIRPLDRFDLRTAYALLAELEDKDPLVVEFTPIPRPEDCTTEPARTIANLDDDSGFDEDYDFRDYVSSGYGRAEADTFEPFVGRMVNGCFVSS
ncbi:MAG: hypothetical protein EON60_04215 [Alphaproteobacteria bacterium]|nr:MAG: hypothetical protein EON60_04215 [Alphaproteobacteria bacterium]